MNFFAYRDREAVGTMVSGVKVDAFKPKEGVKIAANDSEAQSMAQSETNGKFLTASQVAKLFFLLFLDQTSNFWFAWLNLIGFDLHGEIQFDWNCMVKE